MDRTPRKTKVKANALTAPRPRRVSLCRAGANQTALNTAKSESVLVEKKELETMLTAMKSQGFAIAEVAFKGEQWTRAAVDGWMTAGGYTDLTVIGEDGAYTVTSASGAAEGETRTVKTEDGVAVTLVKLPEGEAVVEDGAASDVQPVAKSAEAPVEGGPADRATITIASDAVGNGVDIVGDVAVKGALDIVERAKAVALGEERCKSLYTVSSMASLIRDLRWMVNDMGYDVLYADNDDAQKPAREAVIAELKAIGQQLLNAFAALVSLEVADMADAFKSATEDAMTDTTTKSPIGETAIVDVPTDNVAPGVGDDAKGKDDKGGKDPAEGTEASTEAPVADAAKTEDTGQGESAPSWFASFAEGITNSVKSLTERVDAIDVAKSASGAAEPEVVTAIPASKSADANEQPSASEVQKAQTADAFHARRLKAALGL